MGILAFIGLGLYNLRDLSLGALSFLKEADHVFLESYTSAVPNLSIEELRKITGKEIKCINRKVLESEGGELLLRLAKKGKVALLTPGNPFVATTHIALRLEALKRGIKVVDYPAPSVIDAIVTSTGLQVYKFGRTVTLTYPEAKYGYFPQTPYYVIKENLSRGLHTLLLLDIRAEEGRYMTASEGAKLLLELEERIGEGLIDEETLAVAVARATAPDQRLLAAPLAQIIDTDFGPPPHSLVIPGRLHPMEVEALVVLCNADREVVEGWRQKLERRLRSI